MTIHQKTFQLTTPGRSIINITNEVTEIVAQAAITIGSCNVFLHHTSASLIICENSDLDVQRDLEAFIYRLVPDNDPLYKHIAEGPDDMPSHVRAVLTQNSITIPVTQKKLAFGTWQGLYIWEHRLKPHNRKVTVTVQG